MATRVRLKTEKIKNERDKRPTAHANHIRISPTKVRVVLDVVRGKSVNHALAILKNTPKSASEIVYRLLASAVANAENNQNLSKDDLFVAEIYASGGPVLKRSMPRAKGRSVRIVKRTSHITVVLDQMSDEQMAKVATTTKASTSKNTKTTKKIDIKPKKATTSAKAPVSKPVATKKPSEEKKGTKKPENVDKTAKVTNKIDSGKAVKETDKANKDANNTPKPSKSLDNKAEKEQGDKAKKADKEGKN